jgi:hypothetical protein
MHDQLPEYTWQFVTGVFQKVRDILVQMMNALGHNQTVCPYVRSFLAQKCAPQRASMPTRHG